MIKRLIFLALLLVSPSAYASKYVNADFLNYPIKVCQPNDTDTGCNVSGITGLANPTGTIGLTQVNGSGTTALYSNALPALSQSISPTMTGTWHFSNAISTPGLSNLTSNGFVKTSSGNGTLGIDTNTYCQSSGTGCPGGITGFANPSALVGLTAVNGSFTTAQRSDSALALDQSISPTWTGNHIFSPSSGNTLFMSGKFGFGTNSPIPFVDIQQSTATIPIFISGEGEQSQFDNDLIMWGFFNTPSAFTSYHVGSLIATQPDAVSGITQDDAGFFPLGMTTAAAIDSGSSGAAIGGFFSAQALSGGGTGNNLIGAQYDVENWGTNPIVAAEIIDVLPGNFLVSNTSGATPGPINSLYGLFVENQTAGTNNYAVYTNQALNMGSTNYSMYHAGAAPSYFNGNVGIGVLPDTSIKLTAQGTSLNDGPSLGSEFLDDNNWTSTGWTGSWSTGWTHTIGNTNTLSNSASPTPSTIYQVTFVNSGGMCINSWSFGGVTDSSGSMCSNTTYMFYVQAQSTSGFSITPFNVAGTTNITILPLTSMSVPLVKLNSSNGTNMFEVRAIPSSGSNAGNLFMGTNAGGYTTNGFANEGIGYNALQYNTSGLRNTAVGDSALQANTNGYNNTAMGYAALNSNTTGHDNEAFGYSAGNSNTTGINNFAQGSFSLSSNSTGNNDVAVGHFSLQQSTSSYNTGVGSGVLNALTTGTQDTAIGYNAGAAVSGLGPNQTSNSSIYIGYNSQASADGNSNEIVIVPNGPGNGTNTTTIGNSSNTDNFFTGFMHINNGVYLSAQSSAPTIANNDCGILTQGTVASSPSSTDEAMTINTGTAAGSLTSCRATFGQSHTSAPRACTCNDETVPLALAGTATNTTVTCTTAGTIVSSTIDIICKWTDK